MSRPRLTIRAAVLALSLGLGAAVVAPGVASACSPSRMTVEERAAADRSLQEQLWSNADQVFTATVTRVEEEPSSRPVGPGGVPLPSLPGQARIQVELRPLLALKGDQSAVPATFEFKDIFVGCAPRGLARARVDEIFVVYAANAATNTAASAIPLADIKDPATLAAWEAAGR